ncbi:hypothetical protein L596_014085 [Steinernema carpocapsae]|uniref:RING-type domain-containing protein n=1 Tax=Steinernema carpocapsae TaxID=34508 RepID=A0A4U5NAI1_STECR|nr:hypothetical protein L596_014085 [Steinernema carpocapsae]
MESSALKSIVSCIDGIKISSFLTKKVDKEEIGHVKLRRQQSKDNRVSYSVKWKPRKRNDLSMEGDYPSCTQCAAAPRADDTIFLRRRCQGPCGNLEPIANMTVMGRCEHVICSRCLHSAPHVATLLGGSGCPNDRCFQSDMIALVPDKQERQRQFMKLLSARFFEEDNCGRECCVSCEQCSEYMEYETDSECDKCLCSVTVTLLETRLNSPLMHDLFAKKMFPKSACLLLTMRVLLRDTVDDRLKIENIMDRCYINDSTSSKSWTQVDLDDWRSQISSFANQEDEVRVVIKYDD